MFQLALLSRCHSIWIDTNRVYPGHLQQCLQLVCLCIVSVNTEMSRTTYRLQSQVTH